MCRKKWLLYFMMFSIKPNMYINLNKNRQWATLLFMSLPAIVQTAESPVSSFRNGIIFMSCTSKYQRRQVGYHRDEIPSLSYTENKLKTTKIVTASNTPDKRIISKNSLWIHTPRVTNNNSNNRFMALCPGLPGWAGTRRNTHPPTILIIIQSLSACCIYHDP